MGAHAKTVELKMRINAVHQPKDPAPVDTLDQVPKVPSYFKKDAVELWVHTCEALMGMRCLTLQSLVAIECHVNAVLVMRSVMNDKNSKASTKASVIDQARKSASELGLSQQSHAKIRPPKANAKSSAGRGVQAMLA